MSLYFSRFGGSLLHAAEFVAVLTKNFLPSSDPLQYDDHDVGGARIWALLIAGSVGIALSFGVLAGVAASML